MARAVQVQTAGLDQMQIDGHVPCLVLFSDGTIRGWYGAATPQNAPGDGTTHQGSDWSEARFNVFNTYSHNQPDGQIAVDLVVTNWTDLTDIKGHVLDGWGRVTPFGSGMQNIDSPSSLFLEDRYWGPGLLGGYGFSLARKMCLSKDENYTMGYLMDGYGALHYVGESPAVMVPGQAKPRHFLPYFGTPYWPNWDIARDFVIWFHPTFAGSTGYPVGFLLDGKGYIHVLRFNVSEPYFCGGMFGGGNSGGNDFHAANFVYDFDLQYGYQMDQAGLVYGISHVGVPFGGVGNLPQNVVSGGPYFPGGGTWCLDWPDHPHKFFVTLALVGGQPWQWNAFVIPHISYTFTSGTLTNTSRPAISFIYGAISAVTQNPPPGDLTTVAINLYKLSTTQQPNFNPDQGIDSIFTFYRSGIVDISAGESYSVQTLDDLEDNTDYAVYTKVTSTEGVNSGWEIGVFHTAFVRPPAPGFTTGPSNCRTDRNNPTGARNILVATVAGGLTAGHVLRYQFSDDGVNYYDVAGASATTSLTVYDYEAPINGLRYYRVFRIVVSPYMPSLPSAVVQLTLPAPDAGGGWALKTISTAPTTVTLHAAAWNKTLQNPQSRNFPVSGRKAVVLSAGSKGFMGSLEIWSLDKAKHDAILGLLANPQVLLLQSPFGEQWYVWPDDGVKFELVRAVRILTETWPTRNAHKITVNVTEVERPLVVL